MREYPYIYLTYFPATFCLPLDAEVLGAGLLGFVGGLEVGVEWFFLLFDLFGEGGLFDGLS